MFELIDETYINCCSGKVYSKLLYYFNSTENYKEWHTDHISCFWREGYDFTINSVVYAKEKLYGIPLTLGFKIIKNESNRELEFRILFPYSIVCSSGYFKFLEKDNSTNMIAALKFRGKYIKRGILNKFIESIRKHMQEEGKSIKKVLEEDKEKNLTKAST